MIDKVSVSVIKLIEYSSGEFILCSGPKKIMVVRAFIRIIFVYSAMKNSANGPAAYSTLNPDTSSDSPSVRSNGARFVSARVEMNHIMAIGQVGMISHICSWVVISVCRENEPFISRTDNRMMAIVTSYEIVWATARRAPNREYFEFEAHPDHKIEYTERLDVARINRIPKFKLIRGWGIGSGIHRLRARDRDRVGAIMNSEMEVVSGRIGSFMNSFIASANGCKIP